VQKSDSNHAYFHCRRKANRNDISWFVDGIFPLSTLLNYQGCLATTSFITVPAVAAIASRGDDASHPLYLVTQRVNMMTAICGTVSASILGLAFIFGTKHPYLVYASAVSAVLLRNQRQALEDIAIYIKDQYEVIKEFVLEYYARKTAERKGRPIARTTTKRRVYPTQGVTLVASQQVAGALERLGASSLANFVVSGIAFGIATIGVFGDMD